MYWGVYQADKSYEQRQDKREEADKGSLVPIINEMSHRVLLRGVFSLAEPAKPGQARVEVLEQNERKF